jgi:hypothetical protein
LKGNKQFWTDLAQEIRCLNPMKAWYEFFKARDLSTFDYTTAEQSCQLDKRRIIMKQRPKTHQFLEELFTRYTFLTDFIQDPYRHPITSPISLIHVRKICKKHKQKDRLGTIHIRIDREELYNRYTNYMRRYHISSKVRGSLTFFDEIQRIGGVMPDKPQRIRTGGKIKHVVELYWYDYKKAHIRLYKMEPTPWTFVENVAFYKLLDHCLNDKTRCTYQTVVSAVDEFLSHDKNLDLKAKHGIQGFLC